MTNVFLDTETTGLNPAEDEIIEISIVSEDGRILLDTLVKPIKKTQWPEAQAVNHITPEMVKHSPTLETLKPLIIKAVEECTVYAWNAPFDMSFLKFIRPHIKAERCAMAEFAKFIARTQPSNISKTGRYKLEYTAQDLEIKIKGNAHRAIYDVLTMIEVHKKISNPNFKPKSLNSNINVEAYQKIED